MIDFQLCRDLIHRIAPELDGRLHLLPHRPGWHPLPAGTRAYAVVGRLLSVRDELRRLGEWHGVWWPAIIFADESLTTDEMLGALIHEMAHILPARLPLPDDDDEPTEAQRRYQIAQLSMWAASTPRVPWEGHEAAWIRRVVHLVARAGRHGFDVPLEAVNVAGSQYGLNMPLNYLVELGAEPQYMARRTFAEIENVAAPPSFTRLFQNDVQAWHRSHLLPSEQVA